MPRNDSKPRLAAGHEGLVTAKVISPILARTMIEGPDALWDELRSREPVLGQVIQHNAVRAWGAASLLLEGEFDGDPVGCIDALKGRVFLESMRAGTLGATLAAEAFRSEQIRALSQSITPPGQNAA